MPPRASLRWAVALTLLAGALSTSPARGARAAPPPARKLAPYEEDLRDAAAFVWPLVSRATSALSPVVAGVQRLLPRLPSGASPLYKALAAAAARAGKRLPPGTDGFVEGIERAVTVLMLFIAAGAPYAVAADVRPPGAPARARPRARRAAALADAVKAYARVSSGAAVGALALEVAAHVLAQFLLPGAPRRPVRAVYTWTLTAMCFAVDAGLGAAALAGPAWRAAVSRAGRPPTAVAMLDALDTSDAARNRLAALAALWVAASFGR